MVAARLHTLTVGTAGPRIAFCHGLFGQGRNWTQIARDLAGPDGTQARCLLIDLPDHGRSPWSEHFSLNAYAAKVAAELRHAGGSERWSLVGHSLGGKVAMLVALSQPDLVGRLCVVDIAPRHYRSQWFLEYIAAMRALPLDTLANRAAADAELATVIPSPSVRAFLLQNLRRHGRQWSWQCNFDVFVTPGTGSHGPAGWPSADATAYPAYRKSVLWIAGGESSYIREQDLAPMRILFPHVRQTTVKGAGHWVHTDAPDVVAIALRRWAHLPVRGPR